MKNILKNIFVKVKIEYIFALLAIVISLSFVNVANATTPSLVITAPSSAKLNDHIAVPIVGNNFVGANIVATQFTISYNPLYLKYTGFTPGTSVAGSIGVSTSTVSGVGKIRVVEFDMNNTPLTLTNQNFLVLNFDVISAQNVTANISYDVVAGQSPIASDVNSLPATVTFTNDSVVINAPPAQATSYTLTGPTGGTANSTSGTFTITPNGVYSGTITVTPSGGGLSTPITRTFNNVSTPATFTITPTAVGTVTLTPSSNPTLTKPANLSYVVSAATRPVAPTNLQAAVQSDGSVQLNWTAPTIGSAVTDYTVYYRMHSDLTAFAYDTVWRLFADGVSTLTSARVTGLRNSIPYDFKVYSKNGVGESVTPATVSNVLITVNLGRPTGGDNSTVGGPTNLVATPGDRSVLLRWNVPTAGACAEYYIEYQRSIVVPTEYGEWSRIWENWSTPIRTTTFTVSTNIQNGNRYNFRVSCKNAGILGPSSNEASVVPGIVVIPSNPVTPTAGTVSTITVNITADASTVTSGSATTIRWNSTVATACTVKKSGQTTNFASAPSGSLTSGILTSATTFTITCMKTGSTPVTKAVTVGIASPTTNVPSNPTNLQATADDGSVSLSRPTGGDNPTVGGPTNLVATPGDRSVLLRWNVPTAGACAEYYIEYQRSIVVPTEYGEWSRIWENWSTPIRTTTFTVSTNIQNGNRYNFRVSCKNAGILGPSSNEASVVPGIVAINTEQPVVAKKIGFTASIINAVLNFFGF